MRKIIIRHILLIISLSIFNVGVNAQLKTTRKQYIRKYKSSAIKEMRRSGVPASITLSQGILESNSGNSTLAVQANNHFGIKCHNWTGKTFNHDDNRPNECFRKYKSVDRSFADHSDFLKAHSRYAFLFDLSVTDYKGWANGLKKAGYATNKQYAKLLIKIIEEEKLYIYDKYKPEPILADEEGVTPDVALMDNVSDPLVLTDNVDNFSVNPFNNNVKIYNKINYVVVKDGDTFESISDENEMMPWQLYRYNEMPRSTKLIAGDRIYLQPKRRKASKGNNKHTIAPGENMWIISQRYGIKLKSLYKINLIPIGREPDIGLTISLRKKKKKTDVMSSDY